MKPSIGSDQWIVPRPANQDAMKALLCHNYYQLRGGEDQLFEDEANLLRERGHDVELFTIHNDSIKQSGSFRTATNAIWNRDICRQLSSRIDQFRPDIMHVVNTFPLISPAIFHLAKRKQVPVVATIQNYRYFCAQAMCFRDGSACEACLGKLPWRSIVHKCYRNSRIGSTVVSSVQMVHRIRRTWQEAIDVVCAASEFSKSKLIAAGFSADQIVVKPNFLTKDPGFRATSGEHAIFVGRLSPEKGITTVLEAWGDSQRRLQIVGDGPERASVEAAARRNPNIDYLGQKSNDEIFDLVGSAACLLFSSTGYESMPKTLVESLAVGTPVIGSDVGSVPEIIHDGETGLIYKGGDANSLSESIERFFSDPQSAVEMRSRCRAVYDQKYTADQNYESLILLYEQARGRQK